MMELNGKHNTAKVFTDNIDVETISQVIQLLNQDFVKDSQIRIMSDCHAGSGCVIGTTMTLTDKVVPNLVGVDIGCGMLALQLKEKETDLKQLDEIINKYVPAGFNKHEQPIVEFGELKNLTAPVNVSEAYQAIGSLGGGEVLAPGRINSPA